MLKLIEKARVPGSQRPGARESGFETRAPAQYGRAARWSSPCRDKTRRTSRCGRSPTDCDVRSRFQRHREGRTRRIRAGRTRPCCATAPFERIMSEENKKRGGNLNGVTAGRRTTNCVLKTKYRRPGSSLSAPTEVKVVRNGEAGLSGAYASVKGRSALSESGDLPPYVFGNRSITIR
jgi:hypothetical protein